MCVSLKLMLINYVEQSWRSKSGALTQRRWSARAIFQVVASDVRKFCDSLDPDCLFPGEIYSLDSSVLNNEHWAVQFTKAGLWIELDDVKAWAALFSMNRVLEVCWWSLSFGLRNENIWFVRWSLQCTVLWKSFSAQASRFALILSL